MRVNPSRLKFARSRRGITKTRLAERCCIATRTLTRYESGDLNPSEEVITTLARLLDFPVEFLTDEADLLEVSAGQATFRSSSSMTQTQSDSAIFAGVLAKRLGDYLASQLELPEPDVPDLSGVAPEDAAEQVRAAWGIGAKPIGNLIHLLESKGVRVFSLVEECRSVDAFSVAWDGVPHVFLNTMKSAERTRFDAAHELGHLVLHGAGDRQGKGREREADAFSSPFLMPRQDVIAHAPRIVTLAAIIGLKKRWGVSVAALARRLRDVGCVGEYQYKRLCIELSKRGYRTHEPHPIPREQSLVLRKAFELLREDGIDRAMIAKEVQVSVGELDRMLFGMAMVPVNGDGSGSTGPRAKLSLVSVVKG